MRDARDDSAAEEPRNNLLEELPSENTAVGWARLGLPWRGQRRLPTRRFGVVALASAVLVGAWAAVWVLASASGALTWTAPALLASNSLVPMSATGYSLSSVSCAPSGGLCVAVDQLGNALSTTDPAGEANAWSAANIDGTHSPGSSFFGGTGVSCASTSLCVVVDGIGNVITSTSPTAGAGAWSAANIDGSHALEGVSCASVSLCVAVDDAGNAFTSTTPTDGSSWSKAIIDAANAPLRGVSCPAASLCVAVDNFGYAVTATAPTAGSDAWSPALIDAAHHLNGVSCSSVSLCVAVDDAGNAITSTTPAGGEGAWSIVSIDTHPLTNVSCSAAPLCAAVDDAGNAITSTNPTGGAGAWQPAAINGTTTLSGVSCPSASLCLAVDFSGFGLVGTGADTRQALTVALGGSGSGTVAGAGISCPSTCTASYRKGTVVALTAAPAAGSTFAGWGGACSGTGRCSPTLSSAQAVTATFSANLPTRALAVSIGGLGSGIVAGPGISCPPTCSGRYVAGTVVTLTATPAAPATFSGWNGACSGTGRCSVTLSSDQSVQATFTPLVAPTVTIGRAMRKSKHGHLVSLRFHASGAVSGFRCALVGPTQRKRPTKGSRRRHVAPPKPHFSSCHSPKVYKNLRPGSYAFYVRASGPGGAGRPARRAFTVP